MEDLNLPIERLNNFLSQHEFKVDDPLGDVAPREMYAVVKVELTGTKEMYRAGDKMTFITYTTSIQPSSPMMNTLTGLLMRDQKELELDNQDLTFYVLNNRISDQLQRFLLYWGVENPVICTKVINETNNNINESLIMEGKYDRIVRQIVNDILSVFKTKKVGGFSLPEDLRETDLYYDYPQFKKEFGVFVNFEQSDDVETFEVDGDLYYDDDTIEILVITNPNSGNEILNDLVNELNEVVRHEIEHIIQYDGGMKRKKEPTDSEKYYMQQHELDAQKAGFKRRARREKNDMETLVRNWFKKYPHKHTLNPEQQERVIQKILSEK
jgi:hypothetical protein